MNAKKNLEELSNDEISRLFKMMLYLVEDMKKDHDFHYEKLYKNIPKKYHPIIDTADHFKLAAHAGCDVNFAPDLFCEQISTFAS